MLAITTVKEYIKKEKMLAPGTRVLAAVSGGVDSMCMAHILLALREELDIELSIAHFDHQLRPESAAEGRFVADFSKKAGLSFFAGGADILALGGNLEDTARRERYAFLRSTAAALGGALIAVAHHRDDQAETVLLHLLRGCGTAGLAGMSSCANGIIRPLLFTGREDILTYAASHNIPYCEDSSNMDMRFIRNRIRHRLLPDLANYNPRIVKALNAVADICKDEDELLNDMAENAIAELWLEEKSALEKEGFERLPRALRRRVVRKACVLMVGEDKQPDFEQTEAVLSLKDEAAVSLPGGLVAYCRGDIYFDRQIPPLPKYSEEATIYADGQWHELAAWGWEYRAVPALGAVHDNMDNKDLFSCIISASDLPFVHFRTRRQGDKVRSGGKYGEKKLKNLFNDKHIAIYQRESWPILSREKDILWVAGLWRDDTICHRDKPILIKLRPCDKI